MSRCYPFPPPGFLKDGVCCDALIESIKLQKKAEEIGKREKREYSYIFNKCSSKKERKKEKKSDDKKSRNGKKENIEKHSSSLKRSIDECLGRDFLVKGKGYEAEHLENSGLTEDRDPPTCCQALFYSSAGTQSSYKRRNQSPPSGSNKPQGKVIRIRLTLPKQLEPGTKQEQCSPSQWVGYHPRETIDKSSQAECSTSPMTNSISDEHAPRQANVLPCPLGMKESFVEDNSKDGRSKFSKKDPDIVGSMFEYLTENWVTPQIEGDNFDDLDWLLPRKEVDKPCIFGPPADISVGRRADFLPRACFLPEADIFALPYSVPF